MERFLNWLFRPDCFWRNAGLFLVVVCAIPAAISAFEERRPVAAFAETFVAELVFYVVGLGSVAAGGYAGMKAGKHGLVLGWAVGDAVFMIVGFGALAIGSNIPGVGWRIEKMMSSRDY